MKQNIHLHQIGLGLFAVATAISLVACSSAPIRKIAAVGDDIDFHFNLQKQLCVDAQGDRGLNGAVFAECAKLDQSDLTGSNLQYRNLAGASFRRAKLQNTRLIGTIMIAANLVEADLTGSSMIDADLSSADLRNATLANADLRGANLKAADLSGAKLAGARYSEKTVLPFSEDEAKKRGMRFEASPPYTVIPW